MNRIFVALAVISILVGCATPSTPPALVEPLPDLTNQNVVASKVSIKRDNFKKLTEYLGPNLAQYPKVEGLFIRAWRSDASDTVTYQIYINNYYFDRNWHFYDSAWDSSGLKLSAKVIDRNVERCFDGGCARNEHIGVIVDRKYLDARNETGERIQISGKAGKSECVFHANLDRVLFGYVAIPC